MCVINSVLQSLQRYTVLLLLLLQPRVDATSVASGSRQSLGTVAQHKHHNILSYSLHLPILAPPSSNCLIFSPPLPHPFQHRWTVVESYSHYGPVCMMPCRILYQSTEVITFHRLLGGCWRINAFNVLYLASVAVVVALEHKGWNNMHVTFTQLGTKQMTKAVQ